MKKVIQDIESQLTPPDQYHMNEICMTDQYFGDTGPVTFEYVDENGSPYKNEPDTIPQGKG